jgi:hypothetical protein
LIVLLGMCNERASVEAFARAPIVSLFKHAVVLAIEIRQLRRTISTILSGMPANVDAMREIPQKKRNQTSKVGGTSVASVGIEVQQSTILYTTNQRRYQ